MSNRTLTIAELEKDKSSSVWVKNVSKPIGNINMTMSDGMGATTVITVPVTNIPIDLTTQTTKQAIVASPNFRRMVTIHKLEIIDEELAQELLSSPEARKEAERIYNVITDLASSGPVIEEVQNAQDEDINGNLSGFALNLANNPDMDEDAAVQALKNNLHTLATEDLDYIARKSIHGKVKTLATTELNKSA